LKAHTETPWSPKGGKECRRQHTRTTREAKTRKEKREKRERLTYPDGKLRHLSLPIPAKGRVSQYMLKTKHKATARVQKRRREEKRRKERKRRGASRPHCVLLRKLKKMTKE
jgi:hypothetical protein